MAEAGGSTKRLSPQGRKRTWMRSVAPASTRSWSDSSRMPMIAAFGIAFPSIL